LEDRIDFPSGQIPEFLERLSERGGLEGFVDAHEKRRVLEMGENNFANKRERAVDRVR
jgi:hypothetical protein